MNHTGGFGSTSSQRWKKVQLSKRGEQALAQLEPENQVHELLKVHRDTQDLRDFAERINRKRKERGESGVAHFELDPETGLISVKMFDPESGEMHLHLTPDELAAGLKELEETDDNVRNFSSFFVDQNI